MSYPAGIRPPMMDLEGFPPAQQPANEADPSPTVTARSIYGTFKKGLEKDRGQPRLWLDGAVKLLAAVAVCGLLVSHLTPTFLSTNSSLSLLRSRQPLSQKKSPARHHQSPLLSGHCMDLDPSTCASWFQPNRHQNATSMCAADLQRAKPICSRSCGSCSILLAGCKKLKVMNIGESCKEGEDVVGEVCENDDQPGESYCTYLPPTAEGTKAVFACGLCNDPVNTMNPERKVFLGQMKELRNEEISREDEKVMAQQHRQFAKNYLGDLLPSLR